MSKFCSNCGAALEADKKFCISCGAPVAAAQPVVQPQYIPVAAPQQPVYFTKVKRPGRGLGISSMVLGIIALVYAAIFIGVTIDLLDSVGSYYYYYYSSSDVLEDVLPLFIVPTILSILSTSFGGAGRSKGYKCGVSASGLIMGIISLAACVFGLVLILTY